MFTLSNGTVTSSIMITSPCQTCTLWVICPPVIMWVSSSSIWLPTLGYSLLRRTVSKILIFPQESFGVVTLSVTNFNRDNSVRRRRFLRGPRKMCSSHPLTMLTSNPFQENIPHYTCHIEWRSVFLIKTIVVFSLRKFTCTQLTWFFTIES